MDKMSLVYLASDVFFKGGIERYSRSQIRALRTLFQDSAVHVFSYQAPDENAFEVPFPVEFHGGGSGRFKKGLFSIQVLMRLIRIKPDLIWVNHIHLLPIAYIYRLFCRGQRIALNVYGLEIWSGLSWIEKIALKQVELIIADCHFTAQYVIDEIGLPKDQVHVIWDPVDTERFYPNTANTRAIKSRYHLDGIEDAFILMILGRISTASRHKGYDRLIDLMHGLIDEDIVLIIGGDGNDRERLQARVDDESLRGKVFFTGSVPETDLPDIYQLADVFILVSDRGIARGEGIPLTPLEAASCGKPIIVGDQDGSKEAVQEGENGFIVSPDAPETLKTRVLTLYNDLELRRKMGQRAREIILEDFSFQVFLSRHRDILHDSLENPSEKRILS